MMETARARGLHDVTLFGGVWIALDRENHIHEYQRNKARWVRLIPRASAAGRPRDNPPGSAARSVSLSLV